MKVMILGAGALQVPLIKRAVKRGFETYVVSPKGEEPGFKYAHHGLCADVIDAERILLLARENAVDGVITDQTDLPVRTAAYVAERLGLPGIGYDTASLFTNKYKMRERCRRLGIPVLPHRLARTFEEAKAFFDEIGAPIIVKPPDNQGSRGVSRVDSADELADKISEALSYSQDGTVLVEKFVIGPELVIEGCVCNYEFENLICGDTHYFNIPNVFSACRRVFPSAMDGAVVEEVLRLNEKIIKGFGLRQGITHSEFIISDGVPYLLETAARGGGVFISSDLIHLSTGLNTEDFLLDVALGRADTLPDVQKNLCHCCYIAFALPSGTVHTVKGVEEVLGLPYTYSSNLDALTPGMRAPAFKDKTGRFFITLGANTKRELEERINHIKNTLNISVETEAGQKGPIWS